MTLKKSLVFLIFLNALIAAHSKAIVEYRDSSDWTRKTVKKMNAREKMRIDLQRFGWKSCEIFSGSEASSLFATCFADEKKTVLFDCNGDEEKEITLNGNGMISIKLICSYK